MDEKEKESTSLNLSVMSVQEITSDKVIFVEYISKKVKILVHLSIWY